MSQIATTATSDATKTVCLQAAKRGAELQKMAKELHEICVRSGQTIGDGRCAKLAKDLADLIEMANKAFDACPKRERGMEEASCVAAFCPMAAADIAVSGLGVTLAVLKVQASALRLCKVS